MSCPCEFRLRSSLLPTFGHTSLAAMNSLAFHVPAHNGLLVKFVISEA